MTTDWEVDGWEADGWEDDDLSFEEIEKLGVNTETEPPKATAETFTHVVAYVGNAVVVEDEGFLSFDTINEDTSVVDLVNKYTWSDKVEVVNRALEKLIGLTYKHENVQQLRLEIGSLGGHLAVVKAIQKFQYSCASYGLTVLQNLAMNEDLRASIGQLGGVQLAVTYMKAYPNDAIVGKVGCGLLQSLSWQNSTNQAEILKSGGIQVVVETMKKWPHDADLQRWACATLWHMSLAQKAADETKKMIIQLGCLSAFALTMENHRDNADVLEKADGAMLCVKACLMHQ